MMMQFLALDKKELGSKERLGSKNKACNRAEHGEADTN
jgi:hypothetical protein